jgi:hypothetical protein
MKLFFVIFFLFFIFINSFNIFKLNNLYNINNIKILKTPILNFLPQFKLHHIIVIPEYNNKSIYAIDFSPINQTHKNTLLKLLFAQNVPAEIRIRHINLSKYNLTYNSYNDNSYNDKILINIWHNNNLREVLTHEIVDKKGQKFDTIKLHVKEKNSQYQNYLESQLISDQVFKKIKNKKIKKFITNIKTWNTSMNLYTHNCQHFSQYILIEKLKF